MPTPEENLEQLRREKKRRARTIQAVAGLVGALAIGTCGYQQRRATCIDQAAAELGLWDSRDLNGLNWDALDQLMESKIQDCIFGGLSNDRSD